ncbi:MAG TPA: aldehyde dehydrogenase family protein, partial [Planctomycetaceae bacterium]|nr:aldehyde dehydrogenase family protein [Planctomycetaceae bacterium]
MSSLPGSLQNLLTNPLSVWIGSHGCAGQGSPLTVRSPIDGQILASFNAAAPADADSVTAAATTAFHQWKLVPAPVRGELVRRFGQLLRVHQQDLAQLVTLECGKILPEALGEVQEMIDICDFATGLSRQLHGLTIASERPQHRMLEQWHPLGPVAVISAFNFPVAVWAWNAALALVCGNTLIWKPSEQTPLTAIACQQLLLLAAADMPEVPAAVSTVLAGDAAVGEALARD